MSKQELSEIAVGEAKDEMTDYTTYKRLANSEKSQTNKDMFEKLSEMEHKHYDLWMKYRPQGAKIGPKKATVYFVLFLRRIFGPSFAIKFLEHREMTTVKKYEALASDLVWDTTGSGNCWGGNTFNTSFPAELPACSG